MEPEDSKKFLDDQLSNNTYFFQNIKPPNLEEFQKPLFPFANEDMGNISTLLEMPIKIEVRAAQRKNRKESSSSSQLVLDMDSMTFEHNIISTLPFGEKQLQIQPNFSDQLLGTTKIKKDMIDELFLPEEMLELPQNFGGIKDAVDSKQIFDSSPRQSRFNQTIKMEAKNTPMMLFEKKKVTQIKIINLFNFYARSMEVSMNYHSLSRKDSLNKYYTNIFDVLTKENKKFKELLIQEFNRTIQKLKEKSRPKGRFDGQKQMSSMSKIANKDLINTMAGEERMDEIKRQEIEELYQVYEMQLE